jgi:hypothetical protein
VSDNKGYGAARLKYQDKTANAVGLAGCIAAGVRDRLGHAVTDGCQIAGMIHRDRRSLDLGGYIAALSWYALRYPDKHPAEIIEEMESDPAFRFVHMDAIRHRVMLGSMDAIPPKDEPMVPVWDVARMVGAALMGPPMKGIEPGLGRVLRPIVAPFIDYVLDLPVSAPGPCRAQIATVVKALVEKGVICE